MGLLGQATGRTAFCLPDGAKGTEKDKLPSLSQPKGHLSSEVALMPRCIDWGFENGYLGGFLKFGLQGKELEKIAPLENVPELTMAMYLCTFYGQAHMAYHNLLL